MWQWTLTSGGSSSDFKWADYYSDPLADLGGSPHGTMPSSSLKSFYFNMPCNGKTYTFTMSDSRGNDYSQYNPITMIVPSS